LSAENGSNQKFPLVSAYASEEVTLPSATIFLLVAIAISLVMEENLLEDGCGDDGELSITWVVAGFGRDLFGSFESLFSFSFFRFGKDCMSFFFFYLCD